MARVQGGDRLTRRMLSRDVAFVLRKAIENLVPGCLMAYPNVRLWSLSWVRIERTYPKNDFIRSRSQSREHVRAAITAEKPLLTR